MLRIYHAHYCRIFSPPAGATFFLGSPVSTSIHLTKSRLAFIQKQSLKHWINNYLFLYLDQKGLYTKSSRILLPCPLTVLAPLVHCVAQAHEFSSNIHHPLLISHHYYHITYEQDSWSFVCRQLAVSAYSIYLCSRCLALPGCGSTAARFYAPPCY